VLNYYRLLAVGKQWGKVIEFSNCYCQVSVVRLIDWASAANVVCKDMTYLEPKLFFLIIFYNGIFLIIKILIVFVMNICTYLFTVHNNWHDCTY
jgi:hypothetical protein